MTIRIVTDTTCDIPPEIAADLGITIIPDYINVGEQSFLDGVDLTRREFYERLPHWRTPPSTSAPGLDVFRLVYQGLAAEGASAVVSMHLSERLSNLSNMARLGAQAAAGVPVTVVPGGFISLGGGFVVMAAARAARDGAGLAEILNLIQDVSSRTHIFASLETLEFLRRSGRVPNLAARIGATLHVLPLIKVYQDEVSMELVRSQKRGIDRVIQLVKDLGPLEQLGVVHSNVPDRIDDLLNRVEELFPLGKERLVVDITPVIGSHIGPGALGLAAVQASRA
jgi:DegV family protein with EDD domain